MLTEKEIDDASRKLAEFRTRNSEEDFLQRYADLLVSYKRLKSDYEEEKAGRERYKQIARNQEQNPFVLVIVDGDGYIFNDEYLRQGADGGMKAAHHLSNAIKKSLQAKDLENCHVMIRVYANLANLSKTLAKHALSTADKRSLAPFIANFNRSYGLIDFVDAGELKENADFKIRALLDLYAENAQCKHIYFAACHDVGYLSDLTRFRGDRARLTLIRSSGLLFHDQFLRLDLGVEEFPGIFRSAPLEGPTVQTKLSSGGDLMQLTPLLSPTAATNTTSYHPNSSWEQPKICQFYQAGKCRFGTDCKNTHLDSKFLAPASLQKPLAGVQIGRQSNPSKDFPNGNGRQKQMITKPSTTSLSFLDVNNHVYQLPKKSDIPDGRVAVNKNLQRLDAYIPLPSAAATARLRELSSTRKFCNNKQLTNSCSNESCDYEHKPLSDELLPALEMLSRSLPCAKRGACRNTDCVLGHICQNMDCHYRGGKIKCKLPESVHMADLTVDHYVSDVSHTNSSNANTSAGTPDIAAPCNNNNNNNNNNASGNMYHIPITDSWDNLLFDTEGKWAAAK
ncbi:hypothetical protein GGS21DRAFT_291795 [Xylaria nigripes]|nr:hypothetical protein GGS21DRAFT_291795 [Xylaria nigripes]